MGSETRDWSIQEIARLAGTTSRALRHYDEIGLLPASSIGSNGYRYYDQNALIRLQRILMLRDLGLGLPAIAQVLAGESDTGPALRAHLAWLRQEQDRLTRQIASVETTIAAMERDERLMAEEMFDGFDHTRYREEVEECWGREAYAKGDDWWRGLSAREQEDYKRLSATLIGDWANAAERRIDPSGAEAQLLAQRQYDWLADGPMGPPSREHFIGLGELYVADSRFGANYGGQAGAKFVRDAMKAYAERRL